ncbi:MAG: CoA transferase [Dehalococcoidia bacterium]|nr:CoA transferase [Dehalococcoidia bacterium]
MSMPLEGIRVLDLTQFAFGPRTAAYLAEMGAQVIKIENNLSGEPIRWIDSLRQIPIGKFNAYFEQNHRGKKSMAINLRHEKGREVAYKLIENADIFVTNLRMGGLERLGLDYDTLSRINPRLIYALGTGWGLRGPARDRGAFEVTGLASSGLLSGLVEPDAPPPLCPPAMGDYAAATFLAYGIMLALFHRERTGEGQMVHVSLLGSAMTIASCGIDMSLAAGKDMLGASHDSELPLYNLFQTKDKRWIQLAMFQTDPVWPEFCQALDIEHLKDDPRFNSREAIIENKVALNSILNEVFLTKTLSEWTECLDRYDFIWSPVKRYTELTSDPQVLENEYIVSLDDPEVGEIKVVGITVELSKTPGRIGSKAPELGQHTEEILLELGYTWDDIVTMKEQNAII